MVQKVWTPLLFALWASASTAWADIPPSAPLGQKLISHQLHVEGLASHPDYVLLAWDDGDILRSHRVVLSEAPRQELAHGRSRLNKLSSPRLWLLSRTAYDAWQATTSALIQEQRAACYKGEGCVHISRFVPRYPPPMGAVDCGVQIDITTTVPADGPDQIVDAYRLTEASDSRCVLVPETLIPPDPSKPPPPPPPPASPPPLPTETPQLKPEAEVQVEVEVEVEERGCAHTGGHMGGLGLLLALLLCGHARRTERK